ncbi:glycosyl hydrolase family 18 protein [Kitasatospora sp. MMS16-BH015]|uniref:glycosyl hydrolase family 18 protein n=1 Tax=Kitasatospora sp. MMS16-BH015 TaxID=2018025 RepID=UPI00131A5A8C|nr:glycosyl hydrolase family 18 protein [Kitasatospora sp. MMS16-BH015]
MRIVEKRAGSAAMVLVVVATLAGCVPGAAAGPGRQEHPRAVAVSSARSGLPVLGYQEAGDPTTLIDAAASGLGSVGVDGVNVSADGRTVGTPDGTALAQLATAHAHGLRAELLFGNFAAEQGDFDEEVAHRLLADPANLARVAKRLGAVVAEQGWDGVQVDLESLVARDTAGVTEFVRALRRALPPGRSLGIAVTTYSDAAAYPANGWDLAALGAVVDRVVLMAYDEHGSPGSQPGPVGELAWQEAGLTALLGQLRPEQVDLGVAGYGYRWSPTGAVTQVGVREARAVVAAEGATAAYDGTAGEWHATLADGGVLWWSDARSLADRRELAARHGVHGLALWDLGLAASA